VSIVSQLPLQQSHDELQVMTFSLQTSPSGLHPIGRRQTPTILGAVMTQVTGLCEPPGRPVEPQQSTSWVHRSPTTWQPLAGWHTRIPVGPHGAHARLQQGPPHAGIPPSYAPVPVVPVPAQSCPSCKPQLAGPPGDDAAHVPSVCPAALVQVPVQQSVAAAQASPGCPQNDDDWQLPPAHNCEQHSVFEAHALPSVLQLALSDAHFPAVQFWLQQSAFAEHAWLSAPHDGYVQTPFEQSALQHSAPVVQELPSLRHVPPPPPNTPGLRPPAGPPLPEPPRLPPELPLLTPPSPNSPLPLPIVPSPVPPSTLVAPTLPPPPQAAPRIHTATTAIANHARPLAARAALVCDRRLSVRQAG
jgi:hypothetical protein